MSRRISDRSLALGFWVKHKAAMEAFEYEDEEAPPPELADVFHEEGNRRVLNAILNNATDEGNELIHAIANIIDSEWSRHPSLVVERKRKSSAWNEKLHVRRKRARVSQIIEIGISIEDGSHDELHLFCYLWTRGGRKAAIANAQCVRDCGQLSDGALLDAAALLPISSYWENGVILLAQIPLLEFVTDDHLDTSRVMERTVANTLRCTGAAIETMLAKLREERASR